jgi:hypothetical protein
MASKAGRPAIARRGDPPANRDRLESEAEEMTGTAPLAKLGFFSGVGDR